MLCHSSSDYIPLVQVSATNTNSLAKWIYSQQMDSPESSLSSLELGGLQAIMAFIEIGVETLMKDYVFTFLCELMDS